MSYIQLRVYPLGGPVHLFGFRTRLCRGRAAGALGKGRRFPFPEFIDYTRCVLGTPDMTVASAFA